MTILYFGEVSMNENKDNPKIGRIFQEKVQEWFVKELKEAFNIEHSVSIGKPPHPHNFDLANDSETVVVECKCYTWTDTGNVPSAKLMGLNEAVFYFSFLPSDTEKILVMAYAIHSKRTETLAEYYHRINKHLLRDVKIWEYNTETEEMRKIKND